MPHAHQRRRHITPAAVRPAGALLPEVQQPQGPMTLHEARMELAWYDGRLDSNPHSYHSLVVILDMQVQVSGRWYGMRDHRERESTSEH